MTSFPGCLGPLSQLANQFGIIHLALLCLIMPFIGPLPSRGLPGWILLALAVVVRKLGVRQEDTVLG